MASSGISLGFGAGEPKSQKSSTDLKQRFTDVFSVTTIVTLLLISLESAPERTCVGMFSQVFSVNNVNVVIRTRTEHLTDEEKARIKSKWRVVYIPVLL